jgi:aspartyl-tRNA(Asn)/glutamyl-tRNA(Gln) amidotransferase subunit C
MKITREEVRKVALLARLELSADEEAAFAGDLDKILTYVELLNELDTGAVEPTAHVVKVESPFREDRVTNTPDAEALLASAPARDGTYFKVPKIIDTE